MTDDEAERVAWRSLVATRALEALADVLPEAAATVALEAALRVSCEVAAVLRDELRRERTERGAEG